MKKYRVAVIVLAVLACLALATSCKSKDKDSAPAAATARTLPAGVAPGSHADWCEIHHLPLSLDTKCNPDLIPVFKASGDWCEEHDMPESQCTQCHPEIKFVRPPPDKI